MRYIILADSDNVEPFIEPRQLSVVNGEVLISRTIRLLKDNGIKDIIITSHDKRFNNLGATRYEPKYNDYKPRENKGYWLSAFPIEMLDEAVTFLFGDVYYSEKAIKTIVQTGTESTLFFCSYQNKDKRYIKHHDEPLAYKVADTELFKKHITKVKKMYDEGKTVRHPIVWELYRSINGIDVNTHILQDNYVVINDESCDIDRLVDIDLLKIKLGGVKMVRVKAREAFTIKDFGKLKEIQRVGQDVPGKLFKGDTFVCSLDMAEYLLKENEYTKKTNRALIEEKPIEVIPEKDTAKEKEPEPKKTTKKPRKVNGGKKNG